ncbi:MAG: hypothetical protein WAZ19_02565 [Anaerolineae bacterium]
MPNCLSCNTWNPDDKTHCWRCQAELPKPQVRKARGPRRFFGVPLYLWIAMVFFVVMLIAAQCFATQYTHLAG